MTEDDFWIVIDGKVYDVTPWLDEHPGSWHIIVSATRSDSTKDFNEVGRSLIGREIRERYFIGNLEVTSGGTAAANVPTRPHSAHLDRPGRTAGKTLTKGQIRQAVEFYLKGLRKLLDGPDPIDTSSDAAKAALMSAAQRGHLDYLSLLLSHGADPNFVGDYRTALMCAAENGRLECILKLIEYGADVNLHHEDAHAESTTNEFALLYAAEHGHYYCILALLDHGAEIDAIDSEGTTALMAAASGGHLKCLELLLEMGADINKQKERRLEGPMTALDFARNGGYDECIQFLIDHGAR